MIGPMGGSGPGWLYQGKHYSSPQELHEAMNAEIDKLNLQVRAAEGLLNAAIKGRDDAERLNGELRSLLEYMPRHVSHKEPPHTVEEMNSPLEVPISFRDNCLRCRIDKALGDVADKRICEHKHCLAGANGCTGGQGSCSCKCDDCAVIRNIYPT